MIHRPHNPGFTLPELLISMSIIMLIFAFSGINLLRIIPESGLTEISSSFMADAKSQQQSATMSESKSLSQVDYSIRIDETSYTLFKGSVYSPSDPSNYTVKYPDNITATTTFDSNQLTFSAITGELKNFADAKNQVVFHGLYNRNLTILFNKLGNVYYVNRV